MNTELNADQSAAFLTAKLRAQEPFFFVRYGDGAMECIQGHEGHTCDGEEYSRELGDELSEAWFAALAGGSNVYFGDWLSARFDHATENTRYEGFYWTITADFQCSWLHFEALLLMRESPELLDFYRAAKEDPRRKVFLGPRANIAAAEMLGAQFVETPMQNLFRSVDDLTDELLQTDFEVLYYGAGMAGNIPVTRCWERYPDRTYVHLGSALDPLFRGKTRRQQLSQVRARKLFAELLPGGCICAPCAVSRFAVNPGNGARYRFTGAGRMVFEGYR